MLFVLSSCGHKRMGMKQILLLFIFTFFSMASFSQETEERQSNYWNQASKDVRSQIDLKVFPNPVTGQKFTIEIDNQELSEIRISNIAGKAVVLKKFLTPINKIEISLQNIPNGIYIIQAKTSTNSLAAKKLIVSGR